MAFCRSGQVSAATCEANANITTSTRHKVCFNAGMICYNVVGGSKAGFLFVSRWMAATLVDEGLKRTGSSINE